MSDWLQIWLSTHSVKTQVPKRNQDRCVPKQIRNCIALPCQTNLDVVLHNLRENNKLKSYILNIHLTVTVDIFRNVMLKLIKCHVGYKFDLAHKVSRIRYLRTARICLYPNKSYNCIASPLSNNFRCCPAQPM